MSLHSGRTWMGGSVICSVCCCYLSIHTHAHSAVIIAINLYHLFYFGNQRESCRLHIQRSHTFGGTNIIAFLKRFILSHRSHRPNNNSNGNNRLIFVEISKGKLIRDWYSARKCFIFLLLCIFPNGNVQILKHHKAFVLKFKAFNNHLWNKVAKQRCTN